LLLVAPTSYSIKNSSNSLFLPVTVSSRNVFDVFESTSTLLTIENAIVLTELTFCGAPAEVLVRMK